MRFEFKKFGLNHGDSAMKIGFDSVLLGGWAKIEAGQSVLDIGAGCGILGLMLSQKAAQLNITFLEKDERAAHECQQNIHQMPWKINHSVVAQDFQNFSSQCEEKFDVLTSNPPYFQPNGQIEGVEREQARHQSGLSLMELMGGAAKLAHENSVFYLVFPSQSSEEVKTAARTFGWWCLEEVEVKNKADQTSKRTLWKWGRKCRNSIHSELLVNSLDGRKSKEYLAFVEAFLL